MGSIQVYRKTLHPRRPRPAVYTGSGGLAVSDGREERREQEERRQWELERNREDPIDPYPVDPRQPERRES